MLALAVSNDTLIGIVCVVIIAAVVFGAWGRWR